MLLLPGFAGHKRVWSRVARHVWRPAAYAASSALLLGDSVLLSTSFLVAGVGEELYLSEARGSVVTSQEPI